MIEAELCGKHLCFETLSELFSPRGIDTGTGAMLAQVVFEAEDKVLDLGCGYGPVGIYAAMCIGVQRVVLADVDE